MALNAFCYGMVPARVGDIVVTGAGHLRARYVIHAITIGFDERVVSGEAIVRQSTRKAMELLPQLGSHSIALPAIGTGAAHIPFLVSPCCSANTPRW